MKGEILKRPPLFQRYLDIDYPETLDDEIKIIKDKFQKIEGVVEEEMDFGDLEMMDFEVEQKAPKKTKENLKKPTTEENTNKQPRFTPARGLYYAARISALRYGCEKNSKYTKLNRDDPEDVSIMNDYEICKQFNDYVLKLKDALKILLETDNPNDTMMQFFGLIYDYPVIETEEYDGDESINAWSGSNIDGRVKVVVYPSPDEAHEKKPMGIFVNREQAKILCIVHQVNHFSHYLAHIILAHLPGGQDHFYLALWEKDLCGKLGKKTDINTWSVKDANKFEKNLMDLFSAINITGEWIKRNKKK